MEKIGCSVSNCAHNDSGTCYANKIAINGKKARTSNNTCCSAFLDSSNSGTLTNSVNSDSSCSFVGCNVKTCTHNAGVVCALPHIDVTSSTGKTNISSETYCSSFKCK